MNPAQLLAHFDRISDAPDAIPLLRQFVLDLAVRGKLVEQSPSEESGSELLKQIEAEQVKLLKTKEIKKLEPLEDVDSSEIPFSIPAGWSIARMGFLARKLGAGSTPLGGKSVYQSEGVPFLRSQNVHNDGLRMDDVALIPRSIHDRMDGTHVQRQDVLLNITGASIGRCALVPADFKEGNVSQHVAIIRLFLPDIREFLHLSLIAPFFQRVIDHVQVGVSREGLSMQRLRQFPMLIPPLAEQHRIVAKVDELMALCDRLEAAQTERESRRDRLAASSLHRLNQPADTSEFRNHARFHLRHLPRLTTHPDQIPALRQTILNLAIRGKLVPQDPKDEPAQDLLGDHQVFPSTENEPWKLPLGWGWSSLKLIGETIGGGTPSKSNPEYWSGSVPWVSPKDMKVDIVQDAQDHISELAIENSSTRLIPTGSLLMVVRGMILAHSFPTALNSVPVTINQDMKAVRPFRSDLSQFLLLILKGLKPQVLRLVLRSTHGTCKLLTDDLFSMRLPIAPLAEQHRIVAKVEQLMALCDRLEAQLTTAQSTSRLLLDSLLHEALAPAG